MELEQLKDKLKDVWDTLNGVRKHGIVNGKLSAYYPQDNSCLWAKYSDGKNQAKCPLVEMTFSISGNPPINNKITLRIEKELYLEVSDKVRITTDMELIELKEYLTDFFKACDEAKDRITVIELEEKRKARKELDMGQDLLEIL